MHLLLKKAKLVSTSLSYFYKLILTVLKKGIGKNKPWEIQYRNCRVFDPKKLDVDLKEEFSQVHADLCNKLNEIFLNN